MDALQRLMDGQVAQNIPSSPLQLLMSDAMPYPILLGQQYAMEQKRNPYEQTIGGRIRGGEGGTGGGSTKSGFETLRNSAEQASQRKIIEDIDKLRPKTMQEYITQRTKGMNESEFLNSDPLWYHARNLHAAREARNPGAPASFSKSFTDIANPMMRERFGRDISPEELSKLTLDAARAGIP